VEKQERLAHPGGTATLACPPYNPDIAVRIFKRLHASRR
jgi:hypothetical protein